LFKPRERAFKQFKCPILNVLSGIDTLRKTSRTLICSSHRPQHGVTKVKSLVANDETELKILTLKDVLESSKVSRQPKGKRDKQFKE
jgi:hypothetical protein